MKSKSTCFIRIQGLFLLFFCIICIDIFVYSSTISHHTLTRAHNSFTFLFTEFSSFSDMTVALLYPHWVALISFCVWILLEYKWHIYIYICKVLHNCDVRMQCSEFMDNEHVTIWYGKNDVHSNKQIRVGKWWNFLFLL